MGRSKRAVAGFLIAPAGPGVLLYAYGLVKGYGTAAIVGPMLLIPAAYFAALALGIPVYRLLDRKNVRRCSAYTFGGGLLGLFGSLLPNILAFNSVGSLPPGDLLVGTIYGAISAAIFWGIAVR
jgi:hypothetical protein